MPLSFPTRRAAYLRVPAYPDGGVTQGVQHGINRTAVRLIRRDVVDAGPDETRQSNEGDDGRNEAGKDDFSSDERHVCLLQNQMRMPATRRVSWTRSPSSRAKSALSPNLRLQTTPRDRKSTRLNSSHYCASRMPSSA